MSRLTPHLTYHVNKQQRNADDMTVHQSRLNNVLDSYKLKTIDIPKDGDCLFMSVSRHIERVYHDQEVSNNSLLHHLQTIGLSATMSTASLALHLRELLVHEWLANQGEYRPFFDGTEIDYETESSKYTQSGVFSSDLGDAMLLGLANVLRLRIVVFSSINSWSYFIIHPQAVPIDCPPILLAYLQGGPGHYSLAVKKEVVEQVSPPYENVSSSNKGSKSQCRCGKGKNAADTQRLNCSKKSDYLSRCPCLRRGVYCTSHCKCSNCDNRSTASTSSIPIIPKEVIKCKRHKRERYREQDLCRAPCIKFMKAAGEQPLTGCWNRSESFILLGIIRYICGRNQCNTSGVLGKLDDISGIYDAVLEIVKKGQIQLSLSAKSATQIQAKIRHIIKEEQLVAECGSVNILPNNS